MIYFSMSSGANKQNNGTDEAELAEMYKAPKDMTIWGKSRLTPGDLATANVSLQPGGIPRE
jgi:hypothetical protein